MLDKEIYKKTLIHDQECKNNVFYSTKAKYESILNEIDEIKKQGYTFRIGRIVEGINLKHLVHDLKVSAEVLNYCMRDAEKYKIEENENER